MRFSLLLITLMVLGLTACKKDSVRLRGDYTGTYLRTTTQSAPMSANVTVHLGKDDFSGTTDLNHPAICHGSWKVSGNTIQFNDECIWLDIWLPILTGSFEYTLEGKHLQLKFTKPGVTAVYELDRVN